MRTSNINLEPEEVSRLPELDNSRNYHRIKDVSFGMVLAENSMHEPYYFPVEQLKTRYANGTEVYKKIKQICILKT